VIENWLASSETSYLVRVSHQFAVGEDAKLSQAVTVDLANILYKHTITGVTEMSLTANQPLSNVHRLVVRGSCPKICTPYRVV
jgi:hypothetical protein